MVFENETDKGEQPVTVAVEKFTVGAGLTVIAIVVSSEQYVDEVVSTTLNVEAEANVCVGLVTPDAGLPSPKFQE